MMELDLDRDNAKFHEALLHEYLQDLEKEHNDFIMKELLDVIKEPQKSYMSDLKGKVNRAITKQRTKLQPLPGPAPDQLPDRPPQKKISAF
jgi:hypothetical protein